MAFRKTLPILALAIIAILMSSCRGTHAMQQSLSYRPSNLEYLHESPTEEGKSGKTVYVETRATAKSPGSYKNEKWYIIPLIIYWQSYSKKHLTFFEDGTSKHYSETVRRDMEEDINRHTSLTVTKNKDEADYYLMLGVDSLSGFSFPTSKSHTVFIPLGPYIVYVTNTQYKNEGGVAYSDFSYQLYSQDDELLMSNRISNSEKVADFGEQNLYTAPYFLDHTNHGGIVMALAQTFKKNIRQIADDLNKLPGSEEIERVDPEQKFGSR